MRGQSEDCWKSTLLHHRDPAAATGPPCFAPGRPQIGGSYAANESRQNHTWLSRAFPVWVMRFLSRICYCCQPFSGRIDVLHAARLSVRLPVSAHVLLRALTLSMCLPL